MSTSEILYGSGINVTLAVLRSENNEIVYVIGPHTSYVNTSNGSYAYCESQNGSLCNSSGLDYNSSFNGAFLMKFDEINNTVKNMTIFGREWGAVINVSDKTILSSWGENSCSEGICLTSCMLVVYGLPILTSPDE